MPAGTKLPAHRHPDERQRGVDRGDLSAGASGIRRTRRRRARFLPRIDREDAIDLALDALIANADANLYRAKDEGRMFADEHAGEHVAAGQLKLRAQYGYDNVWSLFYVGKEAELLGCKDILFSDDGPPSVSVERLNAFGDAIWAVYDLRELCELAASVERQGLQGVGLLGTEVVAGHRLRRRGLGGADGTHGIAGRVRGIRAGQRQCGDVGGDIDDFGWLQAQRMREDDLGQLIKTRILHDVPPKRSKPARRPGGASGTVSRIQETL